MQQMSKYNKALVVEVASLKRELEKTQAKVSHVQSGKRKVLKHQPQEQPKKLQTGKHEMIKTQPKMQPKKLQGGKRKVKTKQTKRSHPDGKLPRGKMVANRARFQETSSRKGGSLEQVTEHLAHSKHAHGADKRQLHSTIASGALSDLTDTSAQTRLLITLGTLVTVLGVVAVSWRSVSDQVHSRFLKNQPGEDPYKRPDDEESSSSDSDVDVKEDAASLADLFTECPLEKISYLIDGSNDLDIQFIPPEWTATKVADVLEKHGILTSQWSKEALADVTKEMTKSKARFCKKDGQLLRVVDQVIVLLVYEPEHLVLQEHAHPKYKRSYDEAPEKTVRSRLIGGESLVQCAQRCLDEKLGLETGKMIRVNSDLLKIRESMETFEQCPGLRTLNRQFVVEANVITSKWSDLERLGLVARKLKVADYRYTWEKIHEIRNVRKHLRQKWASLKHAKSPRCSTLDFSLTPVLPWNEDEVTRILQKHSIAQNAENFGMRKHELQVALSEGRVSLGLLNASSCTNSFGSRDNRLVCISENIHMIVKTHDGQILVRACGGNAAPVLPHFEDLPSSAKISTESAWMSSLRLSQEQLKLSTPIFKVDGHTIATIDTLGPNDVIFRAIVVLGPWLPGIGASENILCSRDRSVGEYWSRD